MKSLLHSLLVIGVFLLSIGGSHGQIELGGLPPDISIECDETIPPPANVFIQSNFCDDDTPEIIFSEVNVLNGTCLVSYSIERTWEASNSCGATVSHTQVISIDDTTPPNLTVPADVTISCEQSTDPTTTGNANAFDACSFASLSFTDNIIPGNCPGSYTIFRLWVAQDLCQNQSTNPQIIIVEDNTLPTLLGVPDDLVVSSASEVPDPAQVTATDNCGAPTLSFNETQTGDVITRTWTATDECDNVSSDSQVITIEVSAIPIITVPPDVFLECGESTDPSATGSAISEGGCGGTVISFNDQTQEGNCPGEYTISRTWTATDECGNEDSQTQFIEVRDTTQPTLEGVPADINVQCSSEVPPPADVTSIDFCDQGPVIVALEEDINWGENEFEYHLIRTWTATDACGNSISAQQTIFVEDTTAPVLQGVPQNIIVECDAVPPPEEVLAIDNCENGVALTFEETRIDGSCTNSYTLIRTWYARDAVGNNITQSQQVTVLDTTPPQLIGMADLILPGDENCQALVPLITYQVVDNCSLASSIQVSQDPVEGTILIGPGIYPVTVTAVDECGNSTSSEVLITVEDVVAPIAICRDITLELDASGNASITPADINNGSNDACGLASLSIDNTTFNCADIGSNAVTLTVTDVNGNVSSCQATVTVVDAIAPIITSPENLTRETDPETCTAEVVLPDLIVEDNCEVASIENNSPDLFPVGSTTVTWTVSDIEGNISTVEQVVTITNDAPVINTLVGPASPVLAGTEIQISGTFTDNNLVSANVDWGDGQSSEALIVGNLISGTHIYSTPGTVSIILTVEDACGETAEAAIENLDIISESFEGFVKGAGFFNSPKGAYKSNPRASGRFLFGFLVKNRDHYDHPKGGTIFFFRAGRMLFASHDYEYLRVNEGEAIYQGTGRVNRRKNYQFQVTAVDGQASKTDEYNSDAIKIKIWNEDGVIYENDLTEIWRGHIWIYPFTKHLASARTDVSESYQEVDETIPTIEELISEYGESNIMAYPNPFDESIRIEYVPLATGRASVKIYDLQGRIVATIYDGEVEEFLPLSWEFRPDEYLDKGVYMLRIQDGLLPQTIRLNYHK